jgi:hypothetical protein
MAAATSDDRPPDPKRTPPGDQSDVESCRKEPVCFVFPGSDNGHSVCTIQWQRLRQQTLGSHLNAALFSTNEIFLDGTLVTRRR